MGLREVEEQSVGAQGWTGVSPAVAQESHKSKRKASGLQDKVFDLQKP